MEDVAHTSSSVNSLRFTHFQATSHARLDRAYVSLNLVPTCRDYNVTSVSFRDHCLVAFVVGGKKVGNKFSWELWKLNSRLLKDCVFKESEGIIVKHENAEGESWAAKWELIKQDVSAIARSTTLRRSQIAAEGTLRTNLNQLLALESEMPGLVCDDIAAIKSKLEAMDKVRYQGASVRACSERLLAGEALTKKALGDERKYAQRNEIREIVFRGTLTRECKNMEKAFVEHYGKLFGHCSPRIEEFKRDFLPLIPRLEDEARESLGEN